MRRAPLALLVGLTCWTAPAEEPRKRPVSEVFVGYVNGRAEQPDYGLYTHLCHAFATPDPQGRLQKNEAVPNRALVAEAHRHGVEVLLSLGGWGHDAAFAALVLDPAAETRFLEAVLAMVEEFGYDGIDLDWEYPDSEGEIPGFEKLSRRFRSGLDAIAARRGKPMLLTMAASSSPAALDWLSDTLLLETFDWVNVMTYDYAGAWTPFAGHHAPFLASPKAPGGQSVAATFEHLLGARGLPPERFALGLPLYGRMFSVAQPYAATEGTNAPGRSITFRKTPRLAAEGWTARWDEATKTPWLVEPSGAAVLGYDDARSIRLKTAWARRAGLRGVFFWEVSQDRTPDGGNPLQRAAKSAWRDTQDPGR